MGPGRLATMIGKKRRGYMNRLEGKVAIVTGAAKRAWDGPLPWT